MIAEVVLEHTATGPGADMDGDGAASRVQLWRLRSESAAALPQLRVSLEEWQDDGCDLLSLDARFHAFEGAPFSLCLSPRRANELSMVPQVLTRYQRLLPLPAATEAIPGLQRILSAHRALHDFSKPLARADYDHAHDTWRWLLRLAPEASAAAQLAALFHDIERLESEADRRVEQHAAEYQRFKRKHAERGAQLAGDVLEQAGASVELRRRVCELIEHHEQPETDAELSCLNDADALSFFSLNAVGYLRYFGAVQTQRKVSFTLGRMRDEAASMLAGLRMPAVVSELVQPALHRRFGWKREEVNAWRA
jgi:hypothetical protein